MFLGTVGLKTWVYFCNYRLNSSRVIAFVFNLKGPELLMPHFCNQKWQSFYMFVMEISRMTAMGRYLPIITSTWPAAFSIEQIHVDIKWMTAFGTLQTVTEYKIAGIDRLL